jgi:hypothetical protein
VNQASHIRNQFDGREYIVSTILRKNRVDLHFAFSKKQIPLDVRYQSAIFVRRRKTRGLLSALDTLRPPEFTINLLNLGGPQIPQMEFHDLICRLIGSENMDEFVIGALTNAAYLKCGYTCCAIEHWPSLYFKKVTNIFIAKTNMATFFLATQELLAGLDALNSH